MSGTLVDTLSRVIKAQQRDIADFKVKFEKDPAYALSWSGTAFQAAAMLTVYTEAHRALTSDTPLERVKEHVTREVIRRAGSPSFSTSVVSNLMDTYTLAAWASLAETLRGETV